MVYIAETSDDDISAVTVNGVDVSRRCTAFDTDEGWVDLVMKDVNGEWLFDNWGVYIPEPFIIRHFGRIEFTRE